MPKAGRDWVRIRAANIQPPSRESLSGVGHHLHGGGNGRHGASVAHSPTRRCTEGRAGGLPGSQGGSGAHGLGEHGPRVGQPPFVTNLFTLMAFGRLRKSPKRDPVSGPPRYGPHRPAAYRATSSLCARHDRI